MILHADAVSENRSARVRTRGIHSDDSDSAVFFAVVPRQLIDQRALPRSRSTSHTDDTGFAGVRKQGLEQIGPPGRTILNRADGARERPGISRAHRLNHFLKAIVQTNSVKQARVSAARN